MFDYPSDTTALTPDHHSPAINVDGAGHKTSISPAPLESQHGTPWPIKNASSAATSDLNSVNKSDNSYMKCGSSAEPEESKSSHWPLTKKERILGAASNLYQRRNTERNATKSELPSPTIPPDTVERASTLDIQTSVADEPGSVKPSSFTGKPNLLGGKPTSGKPSVYGSKPSAYTGKPVTVGYGHRGLFKHKKAWLLSQRSMGGSTTLQRTMPGFSYTRDGFAPKISMPLKRPAKAVRQSRKYMYPTRIYSLRSRDKDEDDDDVSNSPKTGKNRANQQKKIVAKMKTLKNNSKVYHQQNNGTMGILGENTSDSRNMSENSITCKKKRKVLESTMLSCASSMTKTPTHETSVKKFNASRESEKSDVTMCIDQSDSFIMTQEQLSQSENSSSRLKTAELKDIFCDDNSMQHKGKAVVSILFVYH